MNGPVNHDEDVALFIDWENFKISLATGHRNPNVSALKEEVSNHGRVVVAKAYADWVTRAPELRGASQFIIDPPSLYAAGIEPVYVPTRLPGGGSFAQESGRTVRVKNSVDVKMTADCIECAHSYPNIRTFVLVSGDSDFIHVINALRTMGKRVIIIGVSWATSRRLADQVDGLILYDVDVDVVTPPETSPPAEIATPVTNGRSTAARSGGPSRRELPEVLRAIEDVVRTERQAGRTPLLTSLKQRLMRRFPGFDEKKLGFSGFKKLVLRTAQEGNIKLVTVGLVDWVIMADEPDPEDAVAETSAGSEASAEAVASPEEEAATLELTEEPRDGAPDETWDPSSEESSTEEPSEAYAAAEPPDEEVEAPAEAPRMAKSTVAEQEAAAGWSPPAELVALAGEVGSQTKLPEGPDDGQTAQRIIDLIIMADTLENSEGVDYVAFNFLVSEVCQALSQGIEAEHDEITRRWGQAYSRNYVTRLIRSLGNAEVFERGWHRGRDKETGKSQRRQSFHLNRAHPLAQQVLESRGGAAPPTPAPHNSELEPADDPDPAPALLEGPEAPESPELDELVLPGEEAGEESEETQPAAPFAFGKVMRFFNRS